MKYPNHAAASQRVQAIKAEQRALVDAADSNDEHPGEFTASQRESFDSLQAECDAILAERPHANRIVPPAQPASPDHRVPFPGTAGRRPARASAFRDPVTGEAVHALSADEPMADSAPDGSIGDLCSAMVRGDVSDLPAEIQGAVTGAGDGGGNYLLSPTLSNRVIDLARSASVVMRAGAQTIPMDANEVHLLRVLSDPTITARRETQSLTATKPTFGRYTLRSKMYGAVVPVTIEELEDAANAGQLIERTLRAALGQAVDQAILTGPGGSDILGITNHDDVNTITSVGAPSNYDDISQAIGDVYAANYAGEPSGLAWVMSPTEGETYDKLKDSQNQPLRPTPWAGAVQRLMTTTMDGEMIVGDFSEVLVGMRTSGVILDVLDAGQATDEDGNTVNAVTDFMRYIRARIRIDAVLMRPSWFTVLSGVTA